MVFEVCGSVHDFTPKACNACAERALAEYEAHQRRADYEQRITEANLPSLHHGVSFDSFAKSQGHNREALRIASSWQPGPTGLYFYGPAGTGKTMLAMCLLKQAMWSGHSGLFLPVPDFLAELRRGFTARGHDKSKDWRYRARRVRLLILDDIGAEKPTAWVRETLLGIIDARVSNKKPTVYTSNHSPSRLDDRLGDGPGRIVDRIIGSSEVIMFEGESFRKMAARNRRKCIRGGDNATTA